MHDPEFKSALALALGRTDHVLHFDLFDGYPVAALAVDTLKGMATLVQRQVAGWTEALKTDCQALKDKCPPWLEVQDTLADVPPPQMAKTLILSPHYEARCEMRGARRAAMRMRRTRMEHRRGTRRGGGGGGWG